MKLSNLQLLRLLLEHVVVVVVAVVVVAIVQFPFLFG